MRTVLRLTRCQANACRHEVSVDLGSMGIGDKVLQATSTPAMSKREVGR